MNNKMKKTVLMAMAVIAAITSCKMNEANPLLEESSLPYGAPAFDRIGNEHYKPAFEAAIARAKADIDAIVANAEDPTFENTIEALEYSGRTLTHVSGIFYNLNEANTNPEMQQIAEDIAPMMTEYQMYVMMNRPLFERVKAVYGAKDSLSLNIEQAKLLEETYKSFARNGANLPEESRAEFAANEEELSILSLTFGKNVLAATNAYILHLTDSADLAGLPEYVVNMAAQEAGDRNLEGWVFTLDQPSYSPFLKYSERRDLRERIWREYNSKCIGGEYDNIGNIRRIIALSTRQANLLGYPTYAAYAIEDRMAGTPQTVDNFIADLMEKTIPAARRDVAEVQEYANANGFEGRIRQWDFSYWSEKYQNEKYALNEEILKPYFKLENVENAVFDLANRLYGLNFTFREDIPVFHPDVRAFEVTDEAGRFMALLYMDYFPRASKRGGAWMTSFREEGIIGGVEQRPFVSVTTNFTKPTGDRPALLTFYEVTTILHEFGHALHGILAEGTYPSLTGTGVSRDFVELPSQIMENWAYEPEYLATFAKHYQTGEVIPQELIDRIVASKNYLAGYSQIRQLDFGKVDMAFYELTGEPQGDLVEFEKNVIASSALFPADMTTAFSESFSHIFAGGYSAGYYSYKWAEVLEADAFSLFKEKGIFNREVAESFRANILSRGSIEPEDVIYRRFRGRDPEPEALLVKLGLK